MNFRIDVPLRTAGAVKTFARELGLDLCGVAAVEDLASQLPPDLRSLLEPSWLRSVIVVGKGIYRGLSTARHAQMRQFANGRLNKRVEDMAGCLADALEYNGSPSIALPTLAVDHARLDFTDILPFAQGSTFVRLAAVRAGVGTLGLNQMLLTPEFGPRVFLAAVLTALSLEPDPPIAGELCLGLEQCGRCAAVCPTGAIPRAGRGGAPLAEVRGLDREACQTASQPEASRSFVSFLQDLASTQETEARIGLVKGWRSGEIWQQMVMLKPGSLTGCMQCALVCPVGEDYDEIAGAPDRQDDLPDGVRVEIRDGVVEVSRG